MKVFEQIFGIVKLSDNQCCIVSGCGTIDARRAARLLAEKHRERQKQWALLSPSLEAVSVTFADLQKLAVAKQDTSWNSLALMMRTISSSAMSRLPRGNLECRICSSCNSFCPFCILFVRKITVSETEAALSKMKSGKAIALDDLPADLWKSRGWCPVV
ncbi:unnamed protein product [Heligmosomoides polygyrus]|uniref:4Fe-4S ferredoxin-type domain-containing protein n=1 Tax=Heligmosomoides polygyrus TaxID=6339 RepID=A0A183F4P9_HELPZ|nr:unnamed protein product [Heligmosomoides polygyrus]